MIGDHLLAGAAGLSDSAGILRRMPRLSQFDRAELAAKLHKQLGIVARRQLSGCGLTDKAIRYRIRPDGPWQIVLPGVYADQPGKLSDRQRAVAAFLFAARPIAITGRTAAAWHGLPAARSEFVDVLVPLRYNRTSAGFVRFLRTSAEPGALFTDGVVSYVPLERAIADAARMLTDMSEVRDLVATGVQRGKVSIWQLMSELQLGPAQGSARLRAVLAEVAEGVRSVAEADLRLIIRQYGVPKPLYNPSLFVGEQFLASPDAWWPDRGVAVEVDSRAWHLSPADSERTMARHDRMKAEGILVLRFPPAELRRSGPSVAKRINATLTVSRGPLPHIVTRPAA